MYENYTFLKTREYEMTNDDMRYLHSIFSRFKIATVERYRRNKINEPNKLSNDLYKQDQLLKKIVIQHEFVMNNIAFMKGSKK